MKKEKKMKILQFSFLIFVGIISSWLVLAQDISSTQVKYCCEKTIYGAWCQNAPGEECDVGYNCGTDEEGNPLKCRKTPTSCEATSYCKLGCCYDSSEGICMENTPQRLCQEQNGTWADDKECNIPQCQLGCCILGTQAAFVTLTRCKKLSAFYGLITNFRRDIGSELECISLASLSDEGACVYEVDFVKTCKFTTRQECNSIKEKGILGNGTGNLTRAITGNVTFYKDYLCSAPELGTNCGPTKETTCVEGKDEVYFLDSCGNIANIYDASKVNDKSYWTKVVKKEKSCGSGSPNINSKTCGNCNYLEGSICKDYKKVDAPRPTYGNYICADLNCKASVTSDGKTHKHGESWCSTDSYPDSVGSRYFRHLCMNGEEIVEPCADFRQEICIQDDINGFSQAACRANRWQDCYSQTTKKDCENKDKRDCIWISDKKEIETKKTEVETALENVEGTFQTQKEVITKVACVPEHAPGLTFWEEGESQGVCSLANTQCVVTFEEKGLIFSGDEKCVDNCECLEDSWKEKQLKKCEALGDCGAKVNWQGVEGNKKGYKIKTKKVKEEEEGGGLFGLSLILNKLGMTGMATGVDKKENVQEQVKIKHIGKQEL